MSGEESAAAAAAGEIIWGQQYRQIDDLPSGHTHFYLGCYQKVPPALGVAFPHG